MKKPAILLKRLTQLLAFAILAALFVLIFGIYRELAGNDSKSYDDLKQAIIQYGNDLNEMRAYLYLPQHNYDFFAQDSQAAAEEEVSQAGQTQYITAIERFAQTLAKEEEAEQNRRQIEKALSALQENQSFNEGLSEMDLGLARKLEAADEKISLDVLVGGDALLSIVGEVESGIFALESLLEKAPVALATEAGAETVLEYVKAKKDAIFGLRQKIEEQKKALKLFLDEEEVKQLLSQNHLTLNAGAVETEAGYEFYATDSAGSPLLTIVLERPTAHFKMEGQTYPAMAELRAPLIAKLKTLNGQSAKAKAAEQKLREMEAYLKSEAFLTALQNSGLQISEPRTHESSLQYDLLVTPGEAEAKLGSIILDTTTGEIQFLKEGQNEPMDLEEVLTGSKKKP